MDQFRVAAADDGDRGAASEQPGMFATGSRVVYENKWMRVREDRVLRSDGSTGIYGVVDKPDYSLVIPAAHGGLFLVQQFRYPVGGRFWEFPQGSATGANDVPPPDLARDELAEETGLRAGSLVGLGYIYEAYGFSVQRCHIFLATDLSQGTPHPEPEELGMVHRWFSEDEVWEMVGSGGIRDSSSVAALALLERHRRCDGSRR